MTSVSPLSNHMYVVNAEADCPGEERLVTEARALLASFTDTSHALRGKFLCFSQEIRRNEFSAWLQRR